MRNVTLGLELPKVTLKLPIKAQVPACLCHTQPHPGIVGGATRARWRKGFLSQGPPRFGNNTGESVWGFPAGPGLDSPGEAQSSDALLWGGDSGEQAGQREAEASGLRCWDLAQTVAVGPGSLAGTRTPSPQPLPHVMFDVMT